MYKKIFKIKVKNKLFYLKPIKLSYANKNYLSWFDDKDVKNNISFKPKNINELKKSISHFLKDKDVLYFYSIFHKQNHIGNIKIDKFNKEENSVHLGILIGNRNYRGIGLGFEIINFLKKKCAEKKIYTIYLGCNRQNTRALNLYLKLGFKIIQKLKNDYRLSFKYLPSKLILGLAQFNSNYGITNFRKKKITKKLEKKILYYASKNGISTVDTSENYQYDIFKNANLLKNFLINSKISTSKSNVNFLKIKNIFQKYKKNKLNLNTVFIHDGDNLFSHNGRKILKILKKLKKEKIFLKIGLSIYNFDIIKKINKSTGIDVIQLPYNLIDNRLHKYQKKLKNLSIKVQVRSIFLQGSMLKKVKNNIYLSEMYDLMSYHARKSNESLFQMCINHPMSNVNIDEVVVGVRSFNDLNMLVNAKIKNKKYNLKISKNLKNKIINPNLWS